MKILFLLVVCLAAVANAGFLRYSSPVVYHSPVVYSAPLVYRSVPVAYHAPLAYGFLKKK